MKTIPLTQGKFAIVDEEDYPELSRYKWCAYNHHKSKRWYATRGIYLGGGRKNCKYKSISMHSEIINVPSGKEIDHRDGNGLNNQKANLRICTHAENCLNQRPRIGGSSVFKGVSWHKKGDKWQAKIGFNHKHYFIGLFVSEIDAARAYDKKAIELFGEFAYPNFR